MLFEGAVLRGPHPGGLRPPIPEVPGLKAPAGDCSTGPSHSADHRYCSADVARAVVDLEREDRLPFAAFHLCPPRGFRAGARRRRTAGEVAAAEGVSDLGIEPVHALCRGRGRVLDSRDKVSQRVSDSATGCKTITGIRRLPARCA